MKLHSLQMALSELLLSDLAVKMYMFLVTTNQKNGVTELAIHFGVYRKKIYDAIEELDKLDLIDDQVENRFINVKSPAIVFSLLKQRQYELNKQVTNLEQSLPEILNNFNIEGRTPSIRVFDGTNKFIYLLSTILDEISGDDEILSYNEGDDFYKLVDYNYFFNIWIEKRVSKKVLIRILLNSENSLIGDEFPKNHLKLRSMKVLPRNTNINGCYWVVGSKLILWDTLTPKAVLIDNLTISSLIKSQFETLWNFI